MDFFDILSFFGGLSLFLFGMNVLGKALERRAGSNLKYMLGKITGSKVSGIAAGIGVTAIIQSSSAATVMTVGFVNSGLMTLSQAINVIIGANVGTCSNAWILSLSGIEGGNFFLSMLKPTSFTPVLALAGVIMYLFVKNEKTKDTGTILLGFAVLMTGMQTMSGSVEGLSELPQFQRALVAFENPLIGVLIGTAFTAVIQSSDAAIGILLALSMTGSVSYAVAIPIIMGANIGTCITAILSSLSATRNAKRAALSHLFFNVSGTVILMAVFIAVKAAVSPAFIVSSASVYGIALAHTLFNIITMFIVAPVSGVLEKFVTKIVPDDKKDDIELRLDDRLLNMPTLAIDRANTMAVEMAELSVDSMTESLSLLKEYDKETAKQIRFYEERSDKYEDVLGTFLVKVSGIHVSDEDSARAAKLLKIIGDCERISDHAVNIVESAEEMKDKKIELSEEALGEISVLCDAVSEILLLSYRAFARTDLESAKNVEPLEQVIDELKDRLRVNQIKRMQQGGSTIETGFIWTEVLTNLERVSDHCSNIAATVIDIENYNMNLHESLREFKNDSEEFKSIYNSYSEKYTV